MSSEERNQQVSYPKTLGQILDAFPLQEISGSTPTLPAKNSLTTGREEGRPARIGKPVSATVLETLRSFAQNVSSGQLLDDQALEMSLAQHFGSSRFDSSKKVDHVYCIDGGYNPVVIGHEVRLDQLDDCEMKIFDALEFFNRPARPDFVAKEIAKLQAVMARRAESNEDIAVVIDVYTDHIAKYPPDVIAAVCNQIIERQRWFPLVSDLVKRCDELVAFRQAVVRCFEEARNPPLNGKRETRRIAADPRLTMSYRDLVTEKWLPCHWDWYVGDAEHMARINRDNGRLTSADEWDAVADKRRTDRGVAQST